MEKAPKTCQMKLGFGNYEKCFQPNDFTERVSIISARPFGNQITRMLLGKSSARQEARSRRGNNSGSEVTHLSAPTAATRTLRRAEVLNCFRLHTYITHGRRPTKESPAISSLPLACSFPA